MTDTALSMERMENLLSNIAEQLQEIRKASAIYDKEVLTLEEASEYTGLKKSYLYIQTHKKGVPHYKRGRAVYFHKEELKAWLLATRVETLEEIDARAERYVARHRRY